ncbi:MAG: class I SAM-dependent methyltransferase, partial [Chloroflexota bacterium]
MTNSKFSDDKYLRKKQYKDASNLNARAYLHENFSTNPSGFIQWEFDQFDFPPNAIILEIGGGPGYLWRLNTARISTDLQLHFTDLSVGMLHTAHEKIQNPQFTFTALSANDIPFSANTFDAVIANHMLYHVPNISKTISEIIRVLKSTGKL